MSNIYSISIVLFAEELSSPGHSFALYKRNARFDDPQGTAVGRLQITRGGPVSIELCEEDPVEMWGSSKAIQKFAVTRAGHTIGFLFEIDRGNLGKVYTLCDHSRNWWLIAIHEGQCIFQWREYYPEDAYLISDHEKLMFATLAADQGYLPDN